MDRITRHELAKSGKIILRSQKQRKGHWAILFYTLNGGWSLFQGGPLYRFENQEKADERIDELVSDKPEKYLKD